MSNQMTENLSFKELRKESWKDFETLFGEKGACGGCWCMYWRLRNKEFENQKGEGNKRAMKNLANKNEQIGIIMYLNNEPIGWCSFAPREDFTRLANSKILKPVDDKPVWSITCFFIDKNFRRQGYSVKMLKGVIGYCKKRKVRILEGYPVEPKKNKMPPAFAWTGIAAAFSQAGFKEVARRSETRPVMRYRILTE
jgi:GNAT superfamily N-acetyltransferase